MPVFAINFVDAELFDDVIGLQRSFDRAIVTNILFTTENLEAGLAERICVRKPFVKDVIDAM